MKPSVVLYHPVAEAVKNRLKEKFQLHDFGPVNESNRDEFRKVAVAADALIGMGLPIPTQDLSGSKTLKAIATISAGYDSFDVTELSSNGIVLMNLFDPLTETTADLAFALLMGTARRLGELDRKMRAGEWASGVGPAWFGLDIHGKTLGIVGMGRIGAAIARRGALGCGMKILYTARTPKLEAEKSLGATKTTLDELLQESDFVCLAVPLSAETMKLIGAREFGLMKKTAIIVNIARGGVVDEAAMIAALQSGAIYGAGLDVFEQEPLPMDSPLLKLDNVLLAPHIGSATQQTRDAMSAYAAETLIDFMCEGKGRNFVNPEALSTVG